MDVVQRFVVYLFVFSLFLGSVILVKPAYASWVFDADPPSTTLTVVCNSTPTKTITVTSAGALPDNKCPSDATIATLTFNCADTGAVASGCYRTDFTINTNPPGFTTTWPYTSPTTLDLTAPSNNVTTIFSTDNAGNKETAFSFTLASSYFISGTVFYDYNRNVAPDPGESAPNLILTLSGAGSGTTTTLADGTFNFPNLAPGNYTVTLTVPAGYVVSLPLSCQGNLPGIPCSVNPPTLPPNTSVTFGIVPTHFISGTVYQDDTGNFCTIVALRVPLSGAAVTLDQTIAPISSTSIGPPLAVGVYSFLGLFAYQANIGPQNSYDVSVNAGVAKVIAINRNNAGWVPGSLNKSSGITFGLTAPPASPPPDFSVEFCVSTVKPWWQTATGDVRMVTITNPVPAGKYSSVDPVPVPSNDVSLFFSSSANANFAPGYPSNLCSPNNPACWVVNNEYSYNSNLAKSRGLVSYSYYKSRANQLGLTIIPLTPVGGNLDLGTVSAGPPPVPLNSGIYEVTGPVNITAYTHNANKHVVLLVNGDVTIKTPIKVDPGICTASNVCNLFVLAASGNIIVPGDSIGGVGETTASSTNTNLDGIYSTEKRFIAEGNGCAVGFPADRRLNIGGTVITNARSPFDVTPPGGNIFENKRSLCGGDANYPSVYFAPRYDFITQLTDFYKETNTRWQEVQP